MAGKVTFVNKNDKSQFCKVNLFGPERNRVRVATVLSVFKACVAIMEDGTVIEDGKDGLSMDPFVAGCTYSISVEPVNLEPQGTPLHSNKPILRSFVKSAAMRYRQWEQAENSGKQVGVEKEGCKNFLVVSADPFGSYPRGFLIWIQKCYKDLKEILVKAEASERFTLLDTAGIGKSVFTIFWICYLATRKEKVAWKFRDNKVYLLDFSDKGLSSVRAMVYGPIADYAPELCVVYDDLNAWLIIDGQESSNLDHSCHILLACSARTKNYKKFSKNQMVKRLYFPVWAKEEITEFLDDFEVERANYEQMNVPNKDVALGYFDKLGGVPRYVPNSKNTECRMEELRKAIKSLSKDTCLDFFTGQFEEQRMSDSIVHMKCRDGKYDTYFYDFASSYVQKEFGNRFTKLSETAVVEYLRSNADESLVASPYGYIFELVGHAVMQRGGTFRMKKVGCGSKEFKDPKDETLMLSDDMKVVYFSNVKELNSDHPRTYYKPRVANFESIDAVVTTFSSDQSFSGTESTSNTSLKNDESILLQFFSSQRGQHGYKVKGLRRLHKKLKSSKYMLCSCVPMERYDDTGYQNFLKADGTKYVQEDKVLDLMVQFVVGVDYNEYKARSQKRPLAAGQGEEMESFAERTLRQRT